MIDTAGTLCTAANELKMMGAARIFAFATHGLFNGPAPDRIEKSALTEVVMCNTVPLKDGTLPPPRSTCRLVWGGVRGGASCGQWF